MTWEETERWVKIPPRASGQLIIFSSFLTLKFHQDTHTYVHSFRDSLRSPATDALLLSRPSLRHPASLARHSLFVVVRYIYPISC